MPAVTMFIQHGTGSSSKHNTIRKMNKWQTHIFQYFNKRHDCEYKKKSLRNIPKNLLKQISGFSKVTGCKLNMKKKKDFIYIYYEVTIGKYNLKIHLQWLWKHETLGIFLKKILSYRTTENCWEKLKI